MKGFVLGAGKGTRLRPLTELLPKPLIPVWNKPLITYAFDHLLNFGVNEFIVNTHHLPECYDRFFREAEYGDWSTTIVHESPEILDTGGGLANVAELVNEEHLIVYNGDVLTDLPLERAVAAHRGSGNLVTLVLRSEGSNCNVRFDSKRGKVCDVRDLLGASGGQATQFTGIYFIRREFLKFVRPIKESIVPAWIRLIEERNALGGVLVDEGHWWDLGDRNTYLEVTRVFPSTKFPSYTTLAPEPIRVHPTARIDPTAKVDEYSVLGAHCVVGPGACIQESVVWEGIEISEGTELHGCIAVGVTLGAGRKISGRHEGADL